MRNVLEILVDDMGGLISMKRRQAYVEEAENQILTKNIEFYEDLRGYLAAHKGEQQAEIRKIAAAVVERQLELLGIYRDRVRGPVRSFQFSRP